MSSIKIKKSINPFVMIDREILLREDISWEAKGLYCYLNSIDLEGIEKDKIIELLIDKFKTTRKITLQIIDELIDAGLIQKSNTKKQSISSQIKLAEIENDELDILIKKQNEINEKKIKLLKAKQEEEQLDDLTGYRKITPETIRLATEEIKDQIDYEVLINKKYIDRNILESILKIIVEIKLTRFQDRNKQPYRINNSLKSITEINNAFCNLNMFHIEYVIENMSKAKKINNPKSYLIASLFNSLSTIDLYYSNKARIDIEEGGAYDE